MFRTIIIFIKALSFHRLCVVHTSKLIINHTQKPRPVEGIFWRGHLVLLMCKFEEKPLFCSNKFGGKNHQQKIHSKAYSGADFGVWFRA